MNGKDQASWGRPEPGPGSFIIIIIIIIVIIFILLESCWSYAHGCGPGPASGELGLSIAKRLGLLSSIDNWDVGDDQAHR